MGVEDGYEIVRWDGQGQDGGMTGLEREMGVANPLPLIS